MDKNFIVGTRNSKLSIIQTEFAIANLERLFPSLKFKIEYFSTPGDRDKNLDLRLSPPDFFTKDLDDAVEAGKISCAIHSAKDLPEKLRDNLDFFWLPWKEDQRDVIIFPVNKTSSDFKDKNIRIGITSKRREEYCKKTFKNSLILPIRGNIEERIAKLDNGEYDMIICAAAGLKRLGLESRISGYIPFEDLQVPDGQGVLAVTFRKGDKIFNAIRKFFIYPVIFAGAGPGNPKLITTDAIEELKNCDVCIYDALCSNELLEHLKPDAKAVFVGKRAECHSHSQEEINLMIANFARQGRSVVRLKGGDPGIFGRLAEETEILDNLDLPFRVIPGISSFQSATTSTGMLLTRRGLSRGFTVFTPRKAVSGECVTLSDDELIHIPIIAFMASKEIQKLSEILLLTGRDPNESVAIIYNAGCAEQRIYHTTLSKLNDLSKSIPPSNKPGLICCGDNFSPRFLFPKNGLLAGKKVLITSSVELNNKIAREILRFDGIPIAMPMIKFEPNSEARSIFLGHSPKITNYDWIAITSPASAKIFFIMLNENRYDLRRLPKIMSSGSETTKEILKYGINPDLQAESDFGSDGLLKKASLVLSPGDTVLRICSDKSLKDLSEGLRNRNFKVDEIILYKTIPLKYNNLPEFDAIFFASPSAVEAFKNNFGNDILIEKDVISLGNITADTIKKTFKSTGKIFIPEKSTGIIAIQKYALNYLNEFLWSNAKSLQEDK